MKLAINIPIILLGLWASTALGFSIDSRCSHSFESNTKVASLVKVTPSVAVSRGRYDLEDFIAETVGTKFLSGDTQIQVELKVLENSEDDVLERLAALGLDPVVSEIPSEDFTITVHANARDLINILQEFSPKSYFLASTYDPRRSIFGLEI